MNLKNTEYYDKLIEKKGMDLIEKRSKFMNFEFDNNAN